MGTSFFFCFRLNPADDDDDDSNDCRVVDDDDDDIGGGLPSLLMLADDDRLFILSAIDGDFAAVDDGASRLVALDRL